jgi:hypothetical protein
MRTMGQGAPTRGQDAARRPRESPVSSFFLLPSSLSISFTTIRNTHHERPHRFQRHQEPPDDRLVER